MMKVFAQSIVETVRHPLLILDHALRVTKANPAFYRTFAVTERDTEGHLVTALSNGQWDLEPLQALLSAVVSGGSAEPVEVEHAFPGVGRKVLLMEARRVAHDDGTPMVLLSVEDVTSIAVVREQLNLANRELHERIRQRTAELESSNRELEAFAYSVSHDLRAPLRALDGFSHELLRRYSDGGLDAQGRHYLERIRAATLRMEQLIDAILKLSSLSRADMRWETVDLSALCEIITSELRQRDPTRRVAVLVERGLTAKGDPTLLTVALENLLGNAWKFTAKREAATITVGRAVRDGRTVFCVRDDGVGFDMAHAGKLFGAFQRLHTEREFPGNGVGLATVQRVIRRHGGRIWAEGCPGQGAAFYFFLPDAGDASAGVSDASE